MVSDSDPASVVQQYLDDVLSGRNPDSIDELVSDASLTQQVSSLRRAFPDLEIVTNLLVAEGDLVAVNLKGRGTHLGTFQGVPPSGRRWAATCSAFYRVGDGGRIEDFWVNWDLLGILEQIGATRRIETASV